MNWDKAIKECPSNAKGICAVLCGNKRCSDAVTSGKCPIKQLEQKSNHNIKVRSLTAQDHMRVMLLDYVSNRFIHCLLKDKRFFVYGVFVDNELVGCCWVGAFADKPKMISDKDYSTDALYLAEVFILPSYRRKGYAKKMLEHVLSKRAKNKTVYCEIEDTKLINLYGKVGFVKMDEEGHTLKRVPC